MDAATIAEKRHAALKDEHEVVSADGSGPLVSDFDITEEELKAYVDQFTEVAFQLLTSDEGTATAALDGWTVDRYVRSVLAGCLVHGLLTGLVKARDATT